MTAVQTNKLRLFNVEYYKKYPDGTKTVLFTNNDPNGMSYSDLERAILSAIQSDQIDSSGDET